MCVYVVVIMDVCCIPQGGGAVGRLVEMWYDTRSHIVYCYHNYSIRKHPQWHSSDSWKVFHSLGMICCLPCCPVDTNISNISIKATLYLFCTNVHYIAFLTDTWTYTEAFALSVEKSLLKVALNLSLIYWMLLFSQQVHQLSKATGWGHWLRWWIAFAEPRRYT